VKSAAAVNPVHASQNRANLEFSKVIIQSATKLNRNAYYFEHAKYCLFVYLTQTVQVSTKYTTSFLKY